MCFLSLQFFLLHWKSWFWRSLTELLLYPIKIIHSNNTDTITNSRNFEVTPFIAEKVVVFLSGSVTCVKCPGAGGVASLELFESSGLRMGCAKSTFISSGMFLKYPSCGFCTILTKFYALILLLWLFLCLLSRGSFIRRRLISVSRFRILLSHWLILLLTVVFSWFFRMSQVSNEICT